MPKLSREQQMEMLHKKTAWKGPWYYDYDQNSLVNANEEVDENRRATAEEFETPTSNICYFLSMLPLEIRQAIYRLLFFRPCGIVPTFVRYGNLIGYRNTKLTIYRYQWEHMRQSRYNEWFLPKYDGSAQGLTTAWYSKPTIAQATLIEAGVFSLDLNEREFLPEYYHEELNAMVRPYIVRRGRYQTQILNRCCVWSTGIQSIDLMCTNRQIHDEAAAVLYGENIFVFDTSGTPPFTEAYGVHSHDTFASNTHLVPGFPNQDGSPMSRRQIAKTINMMFDKDSYHQRFVHRDPLCMFFRAIGRDQASRIKKVKLIGNFKTAENDERYKHNRPLGLAHILPHQVTVLKEVCAGLTELTIEGSGDCELWDDDIARESGRSDEERIDSVVRDAVRALPTLDKLQLGNDEYPPTEEQMVRNWGKAFRWERIVDDRARNRQAQGHAHPADSIPNGNSRDSGKGKGKERVSNQFAPARPRDEYSVLVDQAEVAARVREASPSGSKPNFRKGKKRSGKK